MCTLRCFILCLLKSNYLIFIHPCFISSSSDPSRKWKTWKMHARCRALYRVFTDQYESRGRCWMGGRENCWHPSTELVIRINQSFILNWYIGLPLRPSFSKIQKMLIYYLQGICCSSHLITNALRFDTTPMGID